MDQGSAEMGFRGVCGSFMKRPPWGSRVGRDGGSAGLAGGGVGGGELDAAVEEELGFGDGVLQDGTGKDVEGVAVEGGGLAGGAEGLGALVVGDDVAGGVGHAAGVGEGGARGGGVGGDEGNGGGDVAGLVLIVEGDEDLDLRVFEEVGVGGELEGGAEQAVLGDVGGGE